MWSKNISRYFLLRYNALGKISCIVCGVPIKSEITWRAHVLSKSHKEVCSSIICSVLECSERHRLIKTAPCTISKRSTSCKGTKAWSKILFTIPSYIFSHLRSHWSRLLRSQKKQPSNHPQNPVLSLFLKRLKKNRNKTWVHCLKAFLMMLDATLKPEMSLTRTKWTLRWKHSKRNWAVWIR